MSLGRGAAMLARMPAWLGRFGRDRRATAALEFGFAAPILLLAVLGTVDFGRAIWTTTTLAQAASEAGRYAAIRGAEKSTPATQADVEAFARSRAVGLDPASITVNVTWTPNNAAGSSVTVRVSYPFDFTTMGFLPVDPIQLERRSTMIVG